MALDLARIRRCLKDCDLATLFTQELGWDHHRSNLQVTVEGRDYTLPAIAQKRGMVAYQCQTDDAEEIPDYATRRKIERQVARSVHEHIVVFTNADQEVQVWQWVKREAGRPAACREHTYHTSQPGDALIQKLGAIEFTLEEEEGLTIVDVAGRTRAAFDVDRVTRRFYDRFKTEHAAFLKFIKGIPSTGDREWYASLMLNRLMFVYFIQKKGFLDGDTDYLRNRLRRMRQFRGKDKFLSFYRHFLLRLFHEGLGSQPKDRTSKLDELLGTVPYLNGGLFDVHELEEHNPEITIPDNAFEKLFDFFDAYQWHLDERPLRNDNEINPDVLGYIFEKYINQKQMGAYYTKEDITDYIAKNTVVPFLFDAAEKKCAVAFESDSAMWRLLKEDPDRYIYAAVRHGVIDEDGQVLPLPKEIAAGLDEVSKRKGWNRPADAACALPTETWREHVARRKRCLELRQKLAAGKVHAINDLITLNLDIRQFAQDAIENCEGPELLRAFFSAISTVSVLDPTCGSGAFLFAALNVLEPLYEACLDRMDGFVEDLDRSSGKASPRKFEDFRKTLAQVTGHPNERYFVLKSIIIGNLFGVDIMEEAVEICKLRLFLKLVAQVDTVDQIEPLPDIDFNIRAGNTLVGYTSLDQVRDSVKSELGLIDERDEKALSQIEEDAEIAARAYRQFREMQSDRNMDASQFHDAKIELRGRLDALGDKLDRFLCVDYGVDPKTKPKEFERWEASHQPFHWFTEFFGIMSDGGFDVIMGNPPYVEYREVRNQYTVKNYQTERCGNLYAFTWERCLQLSRSFGRIGMIVPVASVCTSGYAPLQRLLRESGTSVVSNFNDRPSKLFDGLEHIRLCIILHDKGDTERRTFSTTYNKWQAAERVVLFPRLTFTETTDLNLGETMAKIGSPIEAALLRTVNQESESIVDYLADRSGFPICYTRKLSHFVQILDFVPKIWDKDGNEREPSELKEIFLSTERARDVFLSILNSTLFYWLLTVYSDCRNLNKREVHSVRFALATADQQVVRHLCRLRRKLMEDIKDNSQVLTMTYKRLGTLQIQCTYPRFSKSIIDDIDQTLAQHFGFSQEELDFVVNYDIKYRIGQDDNGGE